MDLLSKPISEITPVAPIVCINDPDKIEEQIKLDICDGNECKLLRSDIEIMKADYDNWDHIFKDMRMKVNFEIIIWERAYKVVCELLEENKVEANVIKGEHVQYVRLTHKPIESVCIKEDTRKGFTSFTLPQASTWIQKKILDLKISLGKVENDQQFINAQRERITSIESCLTERENLLAQNSIVFEKLKEIEANLDKEPHAISVGQQDWDKEFREFMSEVEKDNAVLSQMTDDILLLSNKLSALRSENLTDSIVNGVRKEINQLLLRLGGNTPAKAAYAPKTPIKVLSNNNNSNKNDSGENDSIKIDSTKINLAITHSKKNNSKHIDLAQNSSTTNNTNKLGSENTLIKKYFTKIHSTVESTENDLNKINSTRSDTTKIEKSENNIIQVDSIETKLKKSDSSKNDSIKFESFKNLKKKKTTQYATKIDSTENDPNEIGSTENDSIKIDLGKNMLKANSEENNSDKKTSTGKNLYKVDFPKNDLTDDDLNNSVLTKQKSIKIMSIEKDLSSINSGESYSIKINTGENVIKLNSEENSSNTNNSSESKFDKVVSAENTLSDDDLFEIDLTKQESIQNESVEKDLSCIDSPENNFINIKTTEKRYIKNDSTAKDFINIDSTKYYSFEIDSPKNDWERKPDQHDTADTKTIQDEKFLEKNIKQNQNDFYQEECKTKCEDETNNYLQGKYKSNRKKDESNKYYCQEECIPSCPDNTNNGSGDSIMSNLNVDAENKINLSQAFDNSLQKLMEMLSLYSVKSIEGNDSSTNNSKKIDCFKKIDSTGNDLDKNDLSENCQKPHFNEKELNKITSTKNDSINLTENDLETKADLFANKKILENPVKQQKKNYLDYSEMGTKGEVDLFNEFPDSNDNFNYDVPNIKMEESNIELHQLVDNSLQELTDLLSEHKLDDTESESTSKIYSEECNTNDIDINIEFCSKTPKEQHKHSDEYLKDMKFLIQSEALSDEFILKYSKKYLEDVSLQNQGEREDDLTLVNVSLDKLYNKFEHPEKQGEIGDDSTKLHTCYNFDQPE